MRRRRSTLQFAALGTAWLAASLCLSGLGGPWVGMGRGISALAHGPSAHEIRLPTSLAGEAVIPTEIRVPQELVALVDRAMERSPVLRTLQRGLALAESRHRAGMDAVSGLSVGLVTPLKLEAPVETAAEDGNTGGVQLHISKPLGPASELNLSVGAGVGWSVDEDDLAGTPVVELSFVHSVGDAAKPIRLRLDHELRLARHEYAAGRRAWVRDVLDAYGRLQHTIRAATIGELRVRLEEERLSVALARHRQGDISAVRLHQARVRAGEAEDARALARVAVVRARQALFQLTGVALADPPAPATGASGDEAGAPFAAAATVTADPANGVNQAESEVTVRVEGGALHTKELQGWVKTALATRVEPRLAEGAVRLAKARVEHARRQTGWTGQLGTGVTYPDPRAEVSSWDVSSVRWHIGATFAWPLVDVAKSEQLLQAELELREARSGLRAVNRRIEAEVIAGLARLEAATRGPAPAERRRARAALLVGAAEEGVKAGIETETTLLEARVAFSEAKDDVANARFEVIKESVHMWHTLGRDLAW